MVAQFHPPHFKYSPSHVISGYCIEQAGKGHFHPDRKFYWTALAGVDISAGRRSRVPWQCDVSEMMVVPDLGGA